MNYWLIKSEPDTYSIGDLKSDGVTAWTGVRNFQARNNLKSMKNGDICLFYHTGDEKAVVGLAKVVKEAYPDSTAKEGNWLAVDVKFEERLQKPVTLAEVKADPKLKTMQLVTHPRLSVQTVSREQYKRIVR